MKEQGEAHLFPILLGEEHLRVPLLKQLVRQDGLIRHHLVQHPLVVCQPFDEVQDQRGVPLLREAKGQLHGRRLTSASPR